MDKDARRTVQEKRAAKRRRYLQKKIAIIAVLAVILIALSCVLARNISSLRNSGQDVGTKTDAVLNDTPTDGTLAYSGESGSTKNESGSTKNDSENLTSDQTEESPETSRQDEDEEVHEVTLVAIGDVLSHSPLLKMALQSDGTYDFDNYFSVMKDIFVSADIAVVNQETIFGGASKGYTTYPCFNTPESLGDAIVDAGFDVVLHATNHVRDAGVDGIEYCLNYWKTNHPETTVLGIHDSEASSNTVTLYEENGVTFALLNYTYGLNGFTIPEEKSYLVDLMTSETRYDIEKDIETAEELADFVIVFPHWGTENLVGSCTADQKEWAELFTEAGADLIIGTHPHVLEPVEWVESENGNRALCYYSLGNYISNQQDYPNNVGGMAKVVIRKQGGTTEIVEEETGCVPLINSNDRTGSKPLIQVYPISWYTEELMAKHTLHIKDSSFNLDYIKKIAQECLGSFLIWDM